MVRGDVDELGWCDLGALTIVATFIAGLTGGGLTFVEVTGFRRDTILESILINMHFVSAIATVLVGIAVDDVLDREKGREGVFIFVDVIAVGYGGSSSHSPAAAT